MIGISQPGISQILITGSVTDASGVWISGASVRIQNTNQVTVTDSEGRFSIPGDSTSLIEISHVGYSSVRVIPNGKDLEIHLQDSKTILDELIVVGYGTSLRKDVTGAVAKISEADFAPGIITNPLQQLQGKVAGVVITQPGGDPNGDFSVRIRGATSLEGQPPLLVVDGVAIDDFNRYMNTLNPYDIESIDILKDASATAVYGSRGANGVVLITLKKGIASKPTLEYNGFIGVEQAARRLNVLSGDEWRKATKDMNAAGLDMGADTDWQEEISRTGFTQNHAIAFGGAKDRFNFRGSVGYISQEGIVINSGKDVITTRLNADQKNLNDRLSIQFGINTTSVKRKFLPDQQSTNQGLQGGSWIFPQAASILPVIPVYNSDGTYYGTGGDRANPVHLLNEVYSRAKEEFYQASLKPEYEITRGLSIGVLSAISRANDSYDFFDPNIYHKFGLMATKNSTSKEAYTGNIHFNYQKKFGKHDFNVTGVYEYNRFVNEGSGLTASGFQFPDFLTYNLGAATNISTNDLYSFKNEVRIISFLARVVYDFNEQLIVTANVRQDGSSNFGPEHRWGSFPSVSVAWRADQANFLKGFKWIDNLKFRVGYGLTGNQENIPPNSYKLLYGPTGAFLSDGQVYQSYGVIQEYNPELKWEVRKSFNAGVDFSFSNYRFNGTLDFFNDHTNDMLYKYDLPLPPFLTNQVIANAANCVNRGFELTFDAGIIRQDKLTWDVIFNLGTLKNEVTNLSGTFRGFDLSITNRHYGYANGSGLSGAYVSQLAEGYPAGVFWLPVHAGFDEDNRELFYNYDDAGQITGTSTSYNDNDRQYFSPYPDFTWGLTQNFTYGNFDLSIFVRGVQGQKIFANSLLNLGSTVYLPGGNITEEGLTNGFKFQPNPSTYWLMDGSFLRVQNISIGYNFRNVRGISKLRVYATGNNLFVFTKYDGVDPEVNTQGSQRYIDWSYYPKSRGYSLGVNIVL